MSEPVERVRRKRRRQNTAPHAPFGFINPYPYMSDIEAMTKLALERRRLPFSWRYFDGDVPMLKALLPDYAPEFTLLEYKLVITVKGNFFGRIPDVIDRDALAASVLEMGGWKLVVLYETDIRQNVDAALDAVAPELTTRHITGSERPNPYGAVDILARLRAVYAARRAALGAYRNPKVKFRNERRAHELVAARSVHRRRRIRSGENQ